MSKLLRSVAAFAAFACALLCAHHSVPIPLVGVMAGGSVRLVEVAYAAPPFSRMPGPPCAASSFPIVVSIGASGTGGGTVPVSGTGFTTTTQATTVISGVTTTFSVVYTSSSSVTVALPTQTPGYYATGNWPFTITGTGGCAATYSGIFTVTADSTPATIFGANLKGWWIAANAPVSGGNVSGAVPDSSGNSNPLSTISATPPTVVTNDSGFLMPGVTTIAHNGTSSYLQSGTISLGSTTNVSLLGAVYQVNDSGQQTWMQYNAQPLVFTYNGTANELVVEGSVSGLYANTTGVALPSPPAVIFYASLANTGSVQTANVSLDNTTPASNTGSSPPAFSNGPVTVGAQYTGSFGNYANIRWPELILLNITPTSAQTLAYSQYLNHTYGVTTPPSVTYNTPVLASTSGTAFRAAGTGFLPMIVANVICSGTSYALTVVDNAATTFFDGTLPSIPAGTCDLQVQNIDGRSVTFTNVVTVSSTATPMSIFGLSCVLWLGNVYTLNGTNISSWFDLSGMGNSPSQATTLDQPGYCTSTTCTNLFSGSPYATFNGTSQYMLLSPVNTSTGLSNLGMYIISQQGATGVATGDVFSLRSYYAIGLDSKTPFLTYVVSSTVNWSATVSGVQNIVAQVPGGTTPTVSINAANGTAVSSSISSSGIAVSSGIYVGNRQGSGQYTNAPTATIVMTNALASGGQLSSFETYAQSQGALNISGHSPANDNGIAAILVLSAVAFSRRRRRAA